LLDRKSKVATRKRAAKSAPKKQAAKKARGRPEWKPTAEQRASVEAMAGYGVPEEDIARVLKVAPKTLRKQCRDELDLGIIKANAKVSESLFKRATGDGQQAVTAAIWWEKTRQGRKDISVTRHQGPNGGPVQTIDLSKATDEQLAALEALFGPLALAGDDDAADPRGEGEAGN
jgi:hypothetical protein